jgi:predicted transglutaminase-like cysteine proteinase
MLEGIRSRKRHEAEDRTLSKFSLRSGLIPAAVLFTLAQAGMAALASAASAKSAIHVASRDVTPFEASAKQASKIQVGGATSVPAGWLEFCRRYVGECEAEKASAEAGLRGRDISLTARARKQIERVNQWVNANVEPVSDLQQWSMLDRWDYPAEGKGDCEDFVLLKRRLLIEVGFSRHALLVTVVKDSRNEGHALLTVKTDAGDFILDNLNDEMKPWDRTGYRFVKRQSQFDPNVWVQLGPPTPAPDYVSR